MAVYTIDVQGKKYTIEADSPEAAMDEAEAHYDNNFTKSVDEPVDEAHVGSGAFRAAVDSAIHSLPVVGNYVKPSDESSANRAAHPIASNVGGIAGAVLPQLALAVATGGMSIPEQIAGQMALTGGDKLARHNGDVTKLTGTDIASTALSGAGPILKYGKDAVGNMSKQAIIDQWNKLPTSIQTGIGAGGTYEAIKSAHDAIRDPGSTIPVSLKEKFKNGDYLPFMLTALAGATLKAPITTLSTLGTQAPSDILSALKPTMGQ